MQKKNSDLKEINEEEQKEMIKVKSLDQIIKS